MKPRRTALLSSMLGALLTTAPAASAADPDHFEHRHRNVRISSGRIYPKVLEIHSNDALVWINYSSRVARVSFDKSVAAKLKCNSRSAFGVTDDRLVSSRIQGSQFASICNLSAGEYAYRVDLYSSSGDAVSARSFEGKIVVE